MKKLILGLLFVTGTLYGFSQENSHTESASSHNESKSTVDLSMTFKDCDSSYTTTFKVKPGSDKISFSAKSRLSKGDLSFVIIDPEGKRETGFDIGAGRDSKAGNGQLTHEIAQPVAGIWKMKIKISNGTGNITYKIIY